MDPSQMLARLTVIKAQLDSNPNRKGTAMPNETAAPVNVPLSDRIDLAKEAAFQLDALLAEMHPCIRRMITDADSYCYEAVLAALLDRARSIVGALMDAATPSDDFAHNADELERRLRMFGVGEPDVT